MYTLYLIYSESYDLYYVDQTQHITSRLKKHNQNRCRFTKGKGPWKLIATKSFQTRSEVMQAEWNIKKLKNRTYILHYFNSETNNDSVSPDSHY
jgi:putative endonuclease